MNQEKKVFISDKAKKPFETQVNKILKELQTLGDFGLKNRGEISDKIVDNTFDFLKKKLLASKKQFKSTDNLEDFKIEDMQK